MIKDKKGILIDLDGTLYSYKKAHDRALPYVIDFLSKELGVDPKHVLKVYAQARIDTKERLGMVAARHNRMLYFQTTIERLGARPGFLTIEAYNCYWGRFLQSMELFPGAFKFLQKASEEKKVCLVTNLTTYIQHKKIRKLGIEEYFNFIVTSEEVGAEKPNSAVFEMALEKLCLRPVEVCMIGDDWEKDIVGARKLGIDGVWFSEEKMKLSFVGADPKKSTAVFNNALAF